MAKVDKSVDLGGILVQMARLAMAGRPQDVQAFVRQTIKRISSQEKALATRLSELIASSPSASAPLRDAGAALVPVDSDSRLALLRHEYPVILEESPIWAP